MKSHYKVGQNTTTVKTYGRQRVIEHFNFNKRSATKGRYISIKFISLNP